MMSATIWYFFNHILYFLNRKSKKGENEHKKGIKLLMKGDPGIGKTTLLKKIGWDWANNIFDRFLVVFVVFLKLVRPGETIENAIIRQTPILEGLKVTQQELIRFLETFGSKCLLVLDGLDEHVTGENTDTHKMIKGQKYLACNLVVSSRPHSVRSLENYFDTVVRVNGFTVDEAKKFATKILDNENKVRQVLNFNPSPLAEDRWLYNYPILLSFLCLLVREDDVDLSRKAMSIGEIYTRMVRCLYKKYVIRKGKTFSHEQFVSILNSVGKLALQTLLSGNPLLRRSEVEKDVGPDAFDYGLLIGHEEAHRLIRDETADIFVTFPHRSLQEFLGAFYFICMLNDGVSVESIIGFNYKYPIFLMSSLFLHFSLWLMYFGNKYFAILESGRASESLEKYCADKISRFNLVLPQIATTYPALNVEHSLQNKSEIMLKFFKRMLIQLKNVKSFAVESAGSFYLIQPLLGCFTESITYVRVEHTQVVCSNNQLSIHNGSMLQERMLKDILDMVKRHVMFPDVYVHDEGSADLWISIFNTLHDRHPRSLQHTSTLHATPAITKLRILHCQHLTHLTFEHVNLHDSTIAALSRAVEDGRLPSVSHLSMQECDGIRVNISSLFRSQWPKLVSLNLYRVRFSIEGFEGLIRTLALGDSLPKITSLVISIYEPSMITHLFKQKSLFLSGIFLDFPGSFTVRGMGFITQNNFPHFSTLQFAELLEGLVPFSNLTGLSLHGFNVEPIRLFRSIANNKTTLSHVELCWSKSLRDNLSVLLSDNFPSLRSLILKSNNLSSDDLRSLAEAFADGKLPKLNKLDLSYNGMSPKQFKCLFCSQCKWEQLQILYIYDTFISSEKDIIDDFLLPGYFPSLRELGVTNIMEQKHRKTWPKLVTLGVSKHSLENTAKAVDEGLLPNLSELYIFEDGTTDNFRSPPVIRLLKAGVAICKRDSFEWP